MAIWDSPYFQNVFSDFITIAILIVAGWVFYRASRRRSMLRFFECAESRRLLLCLSNLSIKLWSARDLKGLPRSYSGPAVPGYEARLLPIAYKAFVAPVPGFDEQRGFLRFFALRDLELSVVISPREPDALESADTVITVGSAGYNAGSEVAESPTSGAVAKLRLSPPAGVVLTEGGRSERSYIGSQYAIVQKVYNQVREQWFFEVAGSTNAGTTAAYLYLLRNWPKLARRYGNGPGSGFIVILTVEAGQDLPGVAYQSTIL
jgi:hypothetical protein